MAWKVPLIVAVLVLAGPLHLVLDSAAQGNVTAPVVPATHQRLGDGLALVGLVDAAGDQVAWATRVEGAIELRVTNATTNTTRTVTAIPDPDGDRRLSSLAFDGRWVAWSDDRFDDPEVFVAEVATGSLRRISEHPATDGQVDIDDGRIVWVRLDSIHMASAETGESVLFQSGAGPSPRPSIDGTRVVWSQANGTERYIQVRDRNMDGVFTVAREASVARLQPVVDGDLVVWLSLLLPEDPGLARGPRGTQVQLAHIQVATDDAGDQHLATSVITNITEVSAAGGPVFADRYVAWLQDYQGTGTRAEALDVRSGLPFVVEAPVSSLGVSDEYLFFVRAAAGEGPLYARAWSHGPLDLEPAQEGLSSAQVILGLAGLALVLVGIFWTPMKRRFGQR